jgi:hypothetical protein
MKREFDCGHRGLGKFCHRCANDSRPQLLAQMSAENLQAPRKKTTASARSNDPVCHPQIAARQRRPKELAATHRAALASAASCATLDLSAARHLPAVLSRALDVLTQLEAGAHPLSLDGRILTTRGGDFSVPIGRRHRILVDSTSMKPLRFVTHEMYNGLV